MLNSQLFGIHEFTVEIVLYNVVCAYLQPWWKMLCHNNVLQIWATVDSVVTTVTMEIVHKHPC